MLWSVLIASIPERYHSVHPLLFSLLEQQGLSRMPDVELCLFLDNRRRSVGEKRNALLDLAKGEYVSFIDDDDMVAPDYVRRIHRAVGETRKSARPADVICFPQRATLQPHGIIHECTYSLEHHRNRKPEERRQLSQACNAKGEVLANVLAWTGPPAHTMVWRRDLIGDTRFPDRTFGEDSSWVDALCDRAASEIQLGGDALYLYAFNEATSATR